MTLSIYDPTKGCNVLNPKEFVVNAFHPDYIKTHEPELMKSFRTVQANQEERESKVPRKHVKTFKPKVRKPHINSRTNQSMTMEEVRQELLKPKEYRTYSRAGVN